MRRQIARHLLLAGLVATAPMLQAQAARTFKTRLSPVPVAAYNVNIVGTGSVTATSDRQQAGDLRNLREPRDGSDAGEEPSRARSPASVARRCST